MMHTEGEIAGARRRRARPGIPYTLSTMGTTSIEDVAAANPHGRNWFQLYMWKDRDRSMALVDRAAAAGFDTLLVTVDVPVAGARLRDTRNGMTIPPTLTARTVLNAIPGRDGGSTSSPPSRWRSPPSTRGRARSAELLDAMFDPTVTYDDLAWLKDQWTGKLVVKGVQTVDDAGEAGRPSASTPSCCRTTAVGSSTARRCRSTCCPGVDARWATTLEVHLDTGIMSGADIVAAVAHGADFTLIGRAYLYGLMAGGGGASTARSRSCEEIERTMRLLGVTSLDELEPEHVTQLVRLTPR